MAGSRLEKIGTIYTRSKGLIQSGALKWSDRPVWYDIYEAFPPKEEPRFDRPAPKISIRQIFYEEDKIRALLHKKVKNVGAVHLLNNNHKSFTQRFIDTYGALEKQYAGEASEEKILNEALEILKKERESYKELQGNDDISNLGNIVADAQPKQNLNINVKDIFKE